MSSPQLQFSTTESAFASPYQEPLNCCRARPSIQPIASASSNPQPRSEQEPLARSRTLADQLAEPASNSWAIATATSYELGIPERKYTSIRTPLIIRPAVSPHRIPIYNVVFSCELTWRGPCASTGRDKADRQLQNVVYPRVWQAVHPFGKQPVETVHDDLELPLPTLFELDEESPVSSRIRASAKLAAFVASRTSSLAVYDPEIRSLANVDELGASPPIIVFDRVTRSLRS